MADVYACEVCLEAALVACDLNVLNLATAWLVMVDMSLLTFELIRVRPR